MTSNSTNTLSMEGIEDLMKDPVKRTLLLQLLNQEQQNIEKYRLEELKKKTPLKKVKKLHCESPTALHRRRALEKTDTSGSSSSELSEVPTEVKGPKLPFEQLLIGVRAYVEVKRDNEDRSEGIKAVMKLMGATIRDTFTNDVTHVIFKDGSFTTFEKAKLMKIHLVSVLWLDSVRRNNARVPEKNYPAFGNRVCDENVSILCSQIQKDYEDVVKDERRRRHTMMTPKSSMSSYLTAQNIISSDNESLQKQTVSPDLTSDDSDCGIIDGHSSKRSKDSDILHITSSVVGSTNNGSKALESSDSTSLLSHVNKNRRQTVHICSDMILTPNIQPTQTHSSEKIVEATPEEVQRNNRKKVLQSSSVQSTISSLRISSDSDKTKSGLENSKSRSSDDKENCTATTGSVMSSLRISETSKKSDGKRNSINSALSDKSAEGSSLNGSLSDKVTVRGRKKNTSASGDLIDKSRDEISKKAENSKTKKSEEESVKKKRGRPPNNKKSINQRPKDVIQTSEDESSKKSDDILKTRKQASRDLMDKSEDELSNSKNKKSTNSDTSQSEEEDLKKKVGKHKTSPNYRKSTLRKSKEVTQTSEESDSDDESSKSDDIFKTRKQSDLMNKSENKTPKKVTSSKIKNSTNSNTSQSQDESLTKKVIKHKTPINNRKSTLQRPKQIPQTSEDENSDDESSKKSADFLKNNKQKKMTTYVKKAARSLTSDSEDRNPKTKTPRKQFRRKTMLNSSDSDSDDTTPFKEVNNHNETTSPIELNTNRSRRSSSISSKTSSLDGNSVNNLRRSRRSSVALSISNAKEAEISSDVEINTSRSRRSSSISSKTPSLDDSADSNLRRSRRSSVARTTSYAKEAEISSDEEPEILPPVNSINRAKRASSVAPSKPVQKAKNIRRSYSVDRTVPKNKVEAVPSPVKKSRVESSAMNKRRKLYNPNEVTHLSPLASEKERSEYLQQKSQKSPDDMFLNPNDIQLVPLLTKLKPSTSKAVLNELSDDDDVIKKTKKAKKDKTPKVVQRDSSADEQRELLALLDHSLDIRKRRSDRLSLSQSVPKYTYSSSTSQASSLSSLPITPLKRRSTLDFVALTQSQQKRQLRLDPKRATSIVCTKMHNYEVVNFQNIVGKLGRFYVEDKVTGKTSHLVAGESKRTINMLRALARGCWILKHEWLLKSQEAGKWLDEEDYELTQFSPAVQHCRLQKEAFGPLYSMDIFKNCGYIYVGRSTTPKTAELKELISICKGRITTLYSNATIIVGEYVDREGVACVTEMWVLDSILYNKMKSFKHYLINETGSPHV